MKRLRKKVIFLMIFALASFLRSLPILVHSNKGVSISKGHPGNGSIENAYLIDYKGPNFEYFSFISYYITQNGFVNSKLYNTIMDSYLECEKTCPEVKFRIMECADASGGKILFHKTHRTGLSVDFLVPKKNDERQIRIYDGLGLAHYLLDFDSEGCLSIDQEVSIDFETVGKHIIALDNAAKKNGLAISKVILKIDLKDDFYKTKSGKEVKKRGIYFAKSLPASTDNMHDDHYHIDFKILKK
tara:strand:+ start:37 stop:765 length:729 start_codon:yes stop_codon:yes gene_type:complete